MRRLQEYFMLVRTCPRPCKYMIIASDLSLPQLQILCLDSHAAGNSQCCSLLRLALPRWQHSFPLCSNSAELMHGTLQLIVVSLEGVLRPACNYPWHQSMHAGCAKPECEVVSL